MRILYSIGLAAALGIAASGTAFADDNVAACLASDAYLDGGETVDRCDPASRVEGLDARTRSAIIAKLGEAFYFAQRPGLAIPYLDEAIKLDPQADQAFRRRGWAHLMQREISAAMEDFTEYLALKPDDPDAQFAMAYARYTTGGDCNTAAREYELILKDHPDHYITRGNLSGVYRCLDGNRVRELAELGKVLAAGREAIAGVTYYGRGGREDLDYYAHILMIHAGILLELLRYSDAQQEYDWLIANYPRFLDPYLQRSYIKISTRDPLGGLDDAEVFLATYPDYPSAQMLKIESLINLDRDDDVVDYTTQLLARGYETSRTPNIYFWRGISYKHLGYNDEAERDLTRAAATKEGLAWAVHTQLKQSGYLFGPQRDRSHDDRGPPLDTRTAEFANALKACIIDPECFK